MKLTNKLGAIKSKIEVVAYTVALNGLPMAQAFAAGDGFQKASDGLSWLAAGFLSLAVITITLALIFVGYKLLFDGKAWHDVKNIFIGGCVITGASGFAAYWTA